MVGTTNEKETETCAHVIDNVYDSEGNVLGIECIKCHHQGTPLDGLILDTRDWLAQNPSFIIQMNMMRPKPSYTAIELLSIGSRMSASNFFLRREGQPTTRRF